MSILFSGQQLTDVFSVTEIHVLHLLFPTGDDLFFFFFLLELNLITESFKLNEIFNKALFLGIQKG